MNKHAFIAVWIVGCWIGDGMLDLKGAWAMIFGAVVFLAAVHVARTEVAP